MLSSFLHSVSLWDTFISFISSKDESKEEKLFVYSSDLLVVVIISPFMNVDNHILVSRLRFV